MNSGKEVLLSYDQEGLSLTLITLEEWKMAEAYLKHLIDGDDSLILLDQIIPAKKFYQQLRVITDADQIKAFKMISHGHRFIGIDLIDAILDDGEDEIDLSLANSSPMLESCITEVKRSVSPASPSSQVEKPGDIKSP